MSEELDGTSQSMRAILRLRELLLSGAFETGARMSELPLVERLGVSRTPLRLALATLEHEGLLELMPGGGYAVRSFTRADIDDAIDLRGILEGTAARFAAERGIEPEELAAMHACNVQRGRREVEGCRRGRPGTAASFARTWFSFDGS
jgi:GntR family transcriptional regulator of vanillate catabolism